LGERTAAPSNAEVDGLLRTLLQREEVRLAAVNKAFAVTFPSSDVREACLREMETALYSGKHDAVLDKTNAALVVLNQHLAAQQLAGVNVEDAASQDVVESTQKSVPRSAKKPLKREDPVEDSQEVREARAAVKQRLQESSVKDVLETAEMDVSQLTRTFVF